MMLITNILVTHLIYYLGFMKAQLTMKNGKRWSSDKVLYQKRNHALTILTHAYATKVSLFKKKELLLFVW